MKKILLFAVAGVLASCSDDTPYLGSGGGDFVLLTKKTETLADGSQYVSDYRYNDNKIIEVTHSDGTNDIYSYQNNFLVEIGHYTNGDLTGKDNYLYNLTGSLAQHSETSYATGSAATHKWNFTYTGETIGVTEQQTNASGQDETVATYILTSTASGNLTKNDNNQRTILYTFDNYYTPLRQVSNYFVLVLSSLEGGANNITTSQTNTAGIVTNSYSSYTYNSQGFPLTENHTDENGAVTTIEYTY